MPPGFGLFGLHREIDRLFNEFAQGVGPDGAKNIVPSIEISETDKAIEISAESLAECRAGYPGLRSCVSSFLDHRFLPRGIPATS
jgi:hypothetical protein